MNGIKLLVGTAIAGNTAAEWSGYLDGDVCECLGDPFLQSNNIHCLSVRHLCDLPIPDGQRLGWINLKQP